MPQLSIADTLKLFTDLRGGYDVLEEGASKVDTILHYDTFFRPLFDLLANLPDTVDAHVTVSRFVGQPPSANLSFSFRIPGFDKRICLTHFPTYDRKLLLKLKPLQQFVAAATGVRRSTVTASATLPPTGSAVLMGSMDSFVYGLEKAVGNPSPATLIGWLSVDAKSNTRFATQTPEAVKWRRVMNLWNVVVGAGAHSIGADNAISI
jgi:hypothetical protein